MSDGENDFERFERLADLFHRETGLMAPGKDRAAMSYDTSTYQERREAWDAWLSKRKTEP